MHSYRVLDVNAAEHSHSQNKVMCFDNIFFSSYRLVLASKAASSLKNVASFVVGLGEGMDQPTSKVDERRGSTDDTRKAEFSNVIT